MQGRVSRTPTVSPCLGEGRGTWGMLCDAVGCQDHLLRQSRQGAGSKLQHSEYMGQPALSPQPSLENRGVAVRKNIPMSTMDAAPGHAPPQELLSVTAHCPFPQAPLTVEQSVRGILTVLASLSQDTSGAFLDWEGNSLPW